MKEMTEQEGSSLNLIDENLMALQAIFPEAFTEGKVDFDTLRELLGDAVDDSEEKYGLNWFGKKQARQIALTPSLGTLRPCPDESVDWDTTQNLFIEGDNLEVLKLLQKSYAGKVKMIYIDPPYNTGKEFIYPDKFQDNLDTYLKYTGQKDDEGTTFSSNTETSGRYHTNWLNMMYPRLKLARSLLSNEGIIYISIDDNELANLIAICDEIFGRDNRLAVCSWRRRHNQPNDKSKMIAKVSENIIVCSKQIEKLEPLKSYFGVPLSEKRRADYRNPDNDPNGPWTTNPWKAAEGRGGSRYKITLPSGKILDEIWYGNQETFNEHLLANRVHWTSNGHGVPRIKIYLKDADREGQPAINFLDHKTYGSNQDGSSEIQILLGMEGVFSNPKPTKLLKALIKVACVEGIVLDFFCGSGSIADAIMQLNSEENTNRKYICVQLPELVNTKESPKTIKFLRKIERPNNIAEIGKERIRCAGAKIRKENPDYNGDLGFKVFKLDSSNIRVWNPDRRDLEQTLLDHKEHLVPGRNEQDVLYELLLKRGVALAVPIEEKTIAGKTVYSIGYGALFACLNTTINLEDVEALAQGIISWHRELAPASDTQIVFRDSAFAGDIAKTNMTAILEQNGITHVRSL